MNKIGIVIKEALSNRKNPWLWLALGVFLVVIAAVVIIIVSQAKPNLALAANDQSILESRGSDPEIERVPLPQAKSAFDHQQAVFVDVRSSESFSASHIPGSINIPLARILDRYQDLDPSRWIILYCT